MTHYTCHSVFESPVGLLETQANINVGLEEGDHVHIYMCKFKVRMPSTNAWSSAES